MLREARFNEHLLLFLFECPTYLLSPFGKSTLHFGELPPIFQVIVGKAIISVALPPYSWVGTCMTQADSLNLGDGHEPWSGKVFSSAFMSSKEKEFGSSGGLPFCLGEKVRQSLNISISKERSKILKSSFKHLDLSHFYSITSNWVNESVLFCFVLLLAVVNEDLAVITCI